MLQSLLKSTAAAELSEYWEANVPEPQNGKRTTPPAANLCLVYCRWMGALPWVRELSPQELPQLVGVCTKGPDLGCVSVLCSCCWCAGTSSSGCQLAGLGCWRVGCILLAMRRMCGQDCSYDVADWLWNCVMSASLGMVSVPFYRGLSSSWFL